MMFATLPTTYHDFIHWTWPQFEPYYRELSDRALSAADVEPWLADWSQISKIVQETYARLQVASTLDTADAQAEKNYLTFLGEVYPQIETAEQELKQKLLDSGLEPAGFEIPLRNMRAEAALFRETNLPLHVENHKLGSEYNKIIGAQSVTWQGQELTLQQMRPITQDADRDVRERAWRLASERGLADRAAINELWKKLVPLRRQIALNAGCADYREYRWRELLRFDYTPQDCETFQAAIEAVVVPAATRIYEKARQRLGVSSLRPWDCDQDRDPLNYPTLQPFASAAQLIATTEKIFQHVDPQLGAYYTTMRREQLLDLDNRKGKAPGGYCTEYPIAQRPFIFMNAVGLRDDVRTMLHESGHAFHVFETNHLPYIQQLQVPMEFAEVASMSMELLAAPYLPEKFGGFYPDREAARDRIEQLERIILFWPYMATVDAFQQWAHTQPAGADPDACDAKWLELQRRFMPGLDWSGLDAALMTGWHRKQHIHRSPFYYVEYGLAQLGAVQVWRNALTDQAVSLANYRRALALGGTQSLPNLFATAGAKFAFDADTLREAVELIENVIGQLAAGDR
jgi:oligoendopeptidase F